MRHAGSLLTPADAATLIDAASPGTGLDAFIRLALASAARRGELLEARWPDLGYDDDRGCGTLTIACRNGGKTVHARRQVALDLRTMAMLEAWREEQEPDDRGREGYVFSQVPADASPWSPARVTRQVAALAARANIEANVSALRRYSMARLPALGVAPELIGRRLGLGLGTPGAVRFWSAEALLKADCDAALMLAGELDQR